MQRKPELFQFSKNGRS